jgi:hypothetical protein
MSNFLFGQFSFKTNLRASEEIGFGLETSRAALEQGFGIQLGVNVVQKIPIEVLGIERGSLRPDRMPFLIVDYPTTNVSECLISEDGLGHSDSGQDIPYELNLGARLKRIQAFISGICESPLIEQVELFFSEGFDTHYALLHIQPAALAQVAQAKYLEEGRVPSLRLVFSVGAGIPK